MPNPSENKETLDDIDEAEIKPYLNSKTRTKLKTLIWETMNRDYLDEQATKKAAPKRSRVDEKPLKDRKRKPMKHLHAGVKTKKRRSSAVNYDALKSIIPDFDPGDEDEDRSGSGGAGGVVDDNGDDRGRDQKGESDETYALFDGVCAGEEEYEQDFGFGDQEKHFC
ncbi:hypothetical protein J5N97_007000 [Dioscorea zingiberensis]|uniref:Brf1 TBP-binding domain-containing protein n=1 Tax=Dioscorea zingiberensis TaxID=325984 RepID=A0A9D5DCG1_9LILI|nr:hypothetical protein J5N97_007000 [Dioscorea zingiberensis]